MFLGVEFLSYIFTETYTKIETVEERILKAFPKDPIMLEVARCESGLHQFTNGTTTSGKIDSRDKGLFQISLKYWGKTAKELGYDLFTEDGNIRMAKYILEHQGLNSWLWSSKCWLKK